MALLINTTKNFQKQDIATSVNTAGWLNITVMNSAIDSLGIHGSTLIYPITKKKGYICFTKIRVPL